MYRLSNKTEIVKAAILYVTSDTSAGRKVCGFLGHAATLGCSKRLKEFLIQWVI